MTTRDAIKALIDNKAISYDGFKEVLYDAYFSNSLDDREYAVLSYYALQLHDNEQSFKNDKYTVFVRSRRAVEADDFYDGLTFDNEDDAKAYADSISRCFANMIEDGKLVDFQVCINERRDECISTTS